MAGGPADPTGSGVLDILRSGPFAPSRGGGTFPNLEDLLNNPALLDQLRDILGLGPDEDIPPTTGGGTPPPDQPPPTDGGPPPTGGTPPTNGGDNMGLLDDFINAFVPQNDPLADIFNDVFGGGNQNIGLEDIIPTLFGGGGGSGLLQSLGIFGEGGLPPLSFPKQEQGDTNVNVPDTPKEQTTEATATGGAGGSVGDINIGDLFGDFPGAIGDIFQQGIGGLENLLGTIFGEEDLFTNLGNLIDLIQGPDEVGRPSPDTALTAFVENFVAQNAPEFFDRIQGLAFDPLEFSQLEQSLLGGVLGQDELPGLQEGQDLLLSLFPTIAQGAQTGLPQDTRALFNEFAQSIAGPLFAQAAERAPGGVASSGFLAETGNISKELAGEGARAQIAANEAALGRQLDFLSGAPGFVSGAAALPLSALSDVLGLGQTFRSADLFNRGQPLSVLQGLGGLPQQFGQRAETFIGGLGDFFRGFGGGQSEEQRQQRSLFPRR